MFIESITNSLLSLLEEAAQEFFIVTNGKDVAASVLNKDVAIYIRNQKEKENGEHWVICHGINSAVAYSNKCGYGELFKQMMNSQKKIKSTSEEANKAALEKGENNGTNEAEELRACDVQQEKESDRI